jgi:hypothetical protein
MTTGTATVRNLTRKSARPFRPTARALARLRIAWHLAVPTAIGFSVIVVAAAQLIGSLFVS